MLKQLQVKNKLNKVKRKIKHYASKTQYLINTSADCCSIMQASYIKQFYILAYTNLLKQL